MKIENIMKIKSKHFRSFTSASASTCRLSQHKVVQKAALFCEKEVFKLPIHHKGKSFFSIFKGLLAFTRLPSCIYLRP